jgi:hypothetical protein
MLISSKSFGKPSSGAKTLGWEHSKSFLKNVFENLGVACTPLKCFTKRLLANDDAHGGQRRWWFLNDIGDH